jgi:hypothetical protein
MQSNETHLGIKRENVIIDVILLQIGHSFPMIRSDKDFIYLVAKFYSNSYHIFGLHEPEADVLLSQPGSSYQAGPDQVPLPRLLLHAG